MKSLSILEKFLNIQGKLVFDESIENLDSLIHHEEYKAVTNKAELEHVLPKTVCTPPSQVTSEVMIATN